jgi:hypothetical protein
MNRAPLRRISQRFLLTSIVAPLAAIASACGGTSMVDGAAAAGASAAAGEIAETAGAGGSIGRAGSGGAEGGAAAIGGMADAAGSAGTAAAGAGGMGGSGASAGSGGAGGDSGSAGMGVAGNSTVCHATPPQICAGGPITLAKTCVAESSAVVGTSLPVATCRIMCESMFTFACQVSAVQAATLTVQCTTGCPATQK